MPYGCYQPASPFPDADRAYPVAGMLLGVAVIAYESSQQLWVCSEKRRFEGFRSRFKDSTWLYLRCSFMRIV